MIESGFSLLPFVKLGRIKKADKSLFQGKGRSENDIKTDVPVRSKKKRLFQQLSSGGENIFCVIFLLLDEEIIKC